MGLHLQPRKMAVTSRGEMVLKIDDFHPRNEKVRENDDYHHRGKILLFNEADHRRRMTITSRETK